MPTNPDISKLIAGLSQRDVLKLLEQALHAEKRPPGAKDLHVAPTPNVSMTVHLAKHQEVRRRSGKLTKNDPLATSLSPDQIKALRGLEDRVFTFLEGAPGREEAFIADPLAALANDPSLAKEGALRELKKARDKGRALTPEMGDVQMERLTVGVLRGPKIAPK